jgi:hypothetical protein
MPRREAVRPVEKQPRIAGNPTVGDAECASQGAWRGQNCDGILARTHPRPDRSASVAIEKNRGETTPSPVAQPMPPPLFHLRLGHGEVDVLGNGTALG